MKKVNIMQTGREISFLLSTPYVMEKNLPDSPFSTRIPPDIAKRFSERADQLKERHRGVTKGSTTATALSIFLGLPEPMQDELVKEFRDRAATAVGNGDEWIAASLARLILEDQRSFVSSRKKGQGGG